MKIAKCKSQNKLLFKKERLTRGTTIFPFCQFAICNLQFALLILPPSLRERRRYLLFVVMCEREIDKRDLLKEIWDSLYALYGDVGASESKVWLIKYHKSEDTNSGIGILRCAHNKVEEVRASLACIHSVNDTRVSIRVIKTSGTIKGVTRPRR
ncbi:MAG: Rpp14/Pop5 family protein [Candidatus Methanospirareceae archaeon]